MFHLLLLEKRCCSRFHVFVVGWNMTLELSRGVVHPMQMISFLAWVLHCGLHARVLREVLASLFSDWHKLLRNISLSDSPMSTRCYAAQILILQQARSPSHTTVVHGALACWEDFEVGVSCCSCHDSPRAKDEADSGGECGVGWSCSICFC